ncbi:MAG: c-type cytochrome [Planctomycetota bacterium]|nr:c-type cytochrome [Planctomycetota bacterium]MDA1105362.1 c-type cytochrome [Planctomycetota bacterium]
MPHRALPKNPCALTLWAIPMALCVPAFSQRGDQKGEIQRDLPAAWLAVESPPLSADAAQARLIVPDGYRIECVASEPLIEAPIAAMFAPDGALWVLEMRGFMTDPDGTQELDPLGRVSVLRDTDGDGRMDTSTVFVDTLILPRAFAFHRDGLLLVEPPHLSFLRDTDGDGRADMSRVVCTGFEGIESPEHAGNGLLWQHDGSYAFSQHPWSVALLDGEDAPVLAALTRTPSHGQWGVAQDDWGRLYYSPNSDALLCDTLPKAFAAQHASGRGIPGVPRRVVTDQRVWPAHLTPGVNRAYRSGFLRDGRLKEFTAACGPSIYRDSLLGNDLTGNAFVCEAVGNLVMRFNLEESPDGPIGSPADGDTAFIASTDERFRPVNTFVGPDGALYVVDMARGIVQHKLFVTSFLRKQMEARQLRRGNECGRIWRVVPDAGAVRPVPDMSAMTSLELAPLLHSESGAIRDMAQRLLVERVDDASLGATADVVRAQLSSDRPEVRRIALWTLALVGALRDADMDAALADPHSGVRSAAAMVAYAIERPTLAAPLLSDLDPPVRRHALAALGATIPAGALDDFIAQSQALWNDPTARAIIVQSCDGMEADAITSISAHRGQPGADTLQADMLEAALTSGDEARVPLALDAALAARDSMPQACEAMLARALKALRADAIDPSERRRIRCASQPIRWSESRRASAELDTSLRMLDACLIWPGRRGYERESVPLGVQERGRMLYAHCAGCHGASGDGTPGVYPPLRGSPFVTGDADRLLAILLKGLEGRLEVSGGVYDSHMPPAPVEGDEAMAALASYVRQAWGNGEGAVSAQDVARARDRFSARSTPWTLRELHEEMKSTRAPAPSPTPAGLPR